jgi:hypothetical protein
VEARKALNRGRAGNVIEGLSPENHQYLYDEDCYLKDADGQGACILCTYEFTATDPETRFCSMFSMISAAFSAG